MSVVLGKNLNHSVTEAHREMVEIVYIRPQIQLLQKNTLYFTIFIIIASFLLHFNIFPTKFIPKTPKATR